MPPMKVGFTGPFADANFGDYGMLVNNIADLAASLGSISLFTFDAGFVGRIAADYFPSTPTSLHVVKADPAMLHRVSDGYLATPLEVLAGVDNYAEIEKAVGTLDVLVVNGGGYFNELWCQPHRLERTLQLLVPILIADAMGIRTVFTGNTYGPFGARSRFLEPILASLRHAVFCARDRITSIAALRRLGLPEDRIKYVPDDLFILNEGLSHGTSGLDLPERYVVFETYRPLPTLLEHREQLERFGRRMAGEGCEVVVLPMYSGRGGEEQAAWLTNEFGWHRVELNPGYLPIAEAQQVVRGAELVMCDRYHGLVLALANGIPAVHALREVQGDMWYYFSKSLGIIDTALDGVQYRYRDFMGTNYAATLQRVAEDFRGIKQRQQEWFRQGLDGNLALSRMRRSDLLSCVVEGE